MFKDTITFQLATHYLSKVALKLECLLLTIEQACTQKHPVMHHYALKNILEIIKLIEKPELKSRFLKEFMRIEHSLNKSQLTIPKSLYNDLLSQTQFLSQFSGRISSNIVNDPFLQSIMLLQRGDHYDCELHAPQLLLWLECNVKKRQIDLYSWLQKLHSLFDIVSVYLSLLRYTASFDKIHMYNGFYQHTLPSGGSCHLILLKMDKNIDIVPKMHVGHHGLSLRMCDANSMNEVRPAKLEVDLGICQL